MRYTVTAIDPLAGLVSLSVDAASEIELRSKLASDGLSVLRVMPSRTSLRPRGKFSLTLFSHELKALLGAGLNVVEALDTLSEKAPSGESRRLLGEVNRLVHEGHNLSSALEAIPAVFPPLYVASLRAAERTGAIEDALGRYLHYQERLDRVREKLVSASIYPTLLLLAGLGVAMFLLGYVVPRFAGIYQDAGHDIPAASRMLLYWGTFVAEHGWAAFFAFAGFVAAAVAWLRHPSGRRAVGRALWRTPWLGEQLKTFQLARFYRTTGMLLSGGLPALAALDRARGLLPAHLASDLLRAREQIASGQSVSAAMEANGLTTPVALRMLRVGEKTGALDELMERIALFHDNELTRTMERITRLFEPMLMLFIGLLIGSIVVLMYMPVFELAGSLQ